MNPEFVAVDLLPDESFSVGESRTSGGSTLLNYHRGCQITLIVHGFGQRIIGDQVTRYHDGDLAMMGPYLPHCWNEDDHATAHHAIVVSFEEDFLGQGSFTRPEFSAITNLVQRARRGICPQGATRDAITAIMLRLPQLSGMPRLLALLNLLHIWSTAPPDEVVTVASEAYAMPVSDVDEDRLERVFRYIHAHLDQPLSRPEVAKLINLSDSAFSRFFVARVGRSLPIYINELRIGRACRLLLETDRTITTIAHACGYDTLANFNRQFLQVKKMTPTAFRQQLQG
jgi:AraC-like DNA-binding protein